MSVNLSYLVFVDNSVNRIFKTVEALKQSFPNIAIFNQEKDFFDHLDSHQSDVILLNLDLQPNDGLAILKEIKQRELKSDPFIIIYSDKQDDFVQELAFNSGVDSFINFHNKVAVLELFLQNLLRRKIKVSANGKKEVIIDNDRYLILKTVLPINYQEKNLNYLNCSITAPKNFSLKPKLLLSSGTTRP